MEETDNSSSHPYYPRDLLIPHFKANELSQVQLLITVFGTFAVVFIATWLYSGTLKRRLPISISQRLVICWFALCGCIHSVLEGYFGIYHSVIAGDQNILSQLWKEYGKGDSRYIISDNFTVCMENITAWFEGPGCFLVAYALLNRKSYRYVAQMLVSMGQLYGCTLYFVTEVRDGFIHSKMWHPLYFWFYFVFLNMFWMVIPFCMIVQAASHLIGAQAARDAENTKGKNSKKRK
ncbi:3-beta-hydroxysteroid-Delta(8),Delta(7)-isomerase-like [Saccoglossus kowalevskii]|uniref:3-beta-hydroxysteroid-Delta(8), Delta(7)-isomerase-like n=1 Tax=Saccoglossus kowalevskii TaxID=10224 RepID=A0ABM0GVQ5_SACKO|nr:PREDICTED: 3-beta-hydroxysteroid-Delta(8),Delta(7)-isomerase-like [Saccoglossus kowalevskii]